jgi:PAS domain S-box-containing protein
VIVPPTSPGGPALFHQKSLDSGALPVSNKRIETSVLHRSGREFPIELTVWRTHHAGRVLVHALIHDVTERKRAEDRFRTIVEAAPDAMVIVDQHGIMVVVNAQTEKMFAYARPELLGQPVEMLMPERFRVRHRQHRGNFFGDPRSRPMGAGMALFGLRKDGQEFPVEIALSPLRVQGEGMLASAVIRDVSERLATEEKLRQADRLAAIAQMVTGLAHESRNALQQSQACLDLLSLKLGDQTDLQQLVQDIQKAQDQVHFLYEEVRRYAAPIRLKRERFDLGQLLDETWTQLRAACPARRTCLQQQSETADLNCELDRQAIGQVLRQVLQNSLSACHDPAEVQAVWSPTEMAGRAALRLALRDNGPGLKPEQRVRIFEPFFTTKTQGTGLGLAIARRIVEAHGGGIVVGENEAPGTEIIITLPRHPQ